MASMTAQATAQAHWSREYRKRRKAGIRVYEIELPEIEVTEGLRRAGLLAADAESHEEILLAKCAISVAIGGKADMGCCTAHVRF